MWFICGITAIVIWFWGVTLPFVGIYNANNNYLALASNNFLRFGYSTLHFLPTYYVGETLPAKVPYYLHHPVLFFLLASVPIALFGSSNWVVHMMPFLFTLASIVVLYAVIREISGDRIARWSSLCAALFPMTSFFWKYMFFEQASMFFTLTCLFYFIRYLKTENRGYILGLFVSSLLGGAIDWYGGYLLFGFLYLFVIRRDKHTFVGFATYVAGLVLGLSTYAAALYWSGNVHAVFEGFFARWITSELIGLSWWPVRLTLVALLRLLIYFSPFAMIGIWWWLRDKSKKTQGVFSSRQLLIVFIILGLVNLVVLPSATWGHSYFLYYLVPFVSYVMGLWIDRVSYRSIVLVWGVVIVQVFWTVSVNGVKISQVTKQSWKHDFGRDVSAVVPMYSRVGVLEYPGDVLENYFGIATTPISSMDVDRWAIGDGHKELGFVVMACKSDCGVSENSFIKALSNHQAVAEFHYGNNKGWLIGGVRQERGLSIMRKTYENNYQLQRTSTPLLLRWYRTIRDILGSTQI